MALTADLIAKRIYRFKDDNEEFIKNEKIDFEKAHDLCRQFIQDNKKKEDLLSDSVDKKELSKKLISSFVNKLNIEVEGYEGEDGRARLAADLKDEIVDYKAITKYMERPDLYGEIQINGYKNIFVEEKGRYYRVPEEFRSPEELESVIAKIIGNDLKPSVSNAIIDARTVVEGYRVAVVDKSVSPSKKDYIVAIRMFKPGEAKLELEDIIGFGSLSDNMANLARLLPRARISFATTGGTGSGKTVTNDLIAQNIESTDRAAYIENPAEMKPEKPLVEGVYDGRYENNFIRMEAINVDDSKVKSSDPTADNLVNAALRLTPIWIILGEARTEKQFSVLIKASLTGHQIISTFHAENPYESIDRAVLAFIQENPSVPREMALQIICSAFKFIINVERLADGSRKIMYMTEVLKPVDGKPVLRDIYRYELLKTLPDKTIIGEHKRVGIISPEIVKAFRKAGIPDEEFLIYTKPLNPEEEETYNGVARPIDPILRKQILEEKRTMENDYKSTYSNDNGEVGKVEQNSQLSSSTSEEELEDRIAKKVVKMLLNKTKMDKIP